jgi:hypothetical protein
MIEAVENHMPQVVVIDEIGTEAECSAARTIAQVGGVGGPHRDCVGVHARASVRWQVWI